MDEQIAVGGRLVDPETLRHHAQTAETAMDLLSALEQVQLTAIETNQYALMVLPSHVLAVLRETYHELDELRLFLKGAVEEYEEWGRSLRR